MAEATDAEVEELTTLSLTRVPAESIAVLRTAPRSFAFITLALIFPLSFAVLAQLFFIHALLPTINATADFNAGTQPGVLLFQFSYLLFLFTLSLLSTAAVAFTVASLYAPLPVSFTSTLSAVPSIFPRLFLPVLFIFFLLLDDIPRLIYLVNNMPTFTPLFLVDMLLLALIFVALLPILIIVILFVLIFETVHYYVFRTSIHMQTILPV